MFLHLEFASPMSKVPVIVGISPVACIPNTSVDTPPDDLTLNLIFCPTVFSIIPSLPAPDVSM